MRTDQIAAQLYTCRDLLTTPAGIARTLKRIRAIGYTAVQVSGFGGISEEELNLILDGEGLVCCATHESGEKILHDTDAVIERLRKLRCTLTAYPWPAGVDMANLDSLRTLIAGLNRAGEKMAAAGLTLAYHNHDVELVRIDGISALERIYSETDPRFLQSELDTYWIHHGGEDNVAWCHRLRGRLPFIHLKDYTAGPDGKPTFGEIGSGVLPFREIISAAEEAGCRWFIVEQDTTPADPVDSLAQSFHYLSQHLITD